MTWPWRSNLQRGQETALLVGAQEGPTCELLPICAGHLVYAVGPIVQQRPLKRCVGGGVIDLRLEEQGAQAEKGVHQGGGICQGRAGAGPGA